MKGLLLKDMRALKSTFTILAGFMLLYAVFGVVSDNSSMFTAVLAIIIMMLPANSISYDEFYHWDRYVLTMPVSRKMVVQSKYILCFLLVGFMLVTGTVFVMLLDGSAADALLSTMMVAAVSLMMATAALPCMLKWGAQRGRLVLCAVAGAAGAVMATGLMFLKDDTMTIGDAMVVLQDMILLGTLLLTVIVVVVSYFIALRLYERKEF